MNGLERTLAEQQDLKALCSPKAGFRSSEAYVANDNYGHATILKLYMDWPIEQPLPALIPHGIYADDGKVFPGEAETPHPLVLSYPEYRDKAYRRGSRKMVIPSASPFLYALELIERVEVAQPKGTIFFPMHSTAIVDVDTDWDALAQRCADLPEKYQPVTCCIHWQDFHRGRHKPFEDRGMRVVSAGYLHDPDFLFRLIHLLDMHAYAASNDVASNLFFAVATGTPYFLLGDPVKEFSLDPTFPVPDYEAPEWTARVSEVRALFAQPVDELTDEQRACAAYYLGASRKKSGDFMREEILRATWMAGPR